MLLAELNVRHTRRHMPTRRVALGDRVLPTGHPGYGPLLLAGVAGISVSGLDEEQSDALGSFLRQAKHGLMIPRRALRFRIQTDTEGLAHSRHRLLGDGDGLVLELDVHGQHPVPQLIGAIMAAALMAPYPRGLALAAIHSAIERPGVLPEGITPRYVTEARARPFDPTMAPKAYEVNVGLPGHDWFGIPAERRWAMEVLGFGPQASPERDDVLRRFRRLVRLAHPDHGAADRGAAERIVELGEARRVLLGGSETVSGPAVT